MYIVYFCDEKRRNFEGNFMPIPLMACPEISKEKFFLLMNKRTVNNFPKGRELRDPKMHPKVNRMARSQGQDVA